MNEHSIELPEDAIRWDLKPSVREVDDCIMVKLSWGWTAGMTEDEVNSLAEDSPRGCESIETSLDSMISLRDQLDEIIETNKERNDELVKASREKMEELTERIKDIFPLKD